MSILKSLKSSPTVASAIRQYESLPTRDQKALLLLGGVVVIFILYFVVWSPAHNFAKKQEANLASSKELLSWVQANQQVARSLATDIKRDTSKVVDSQSLVSTISTNAQKHKISLKRFEPSGDRKVRVWLEKVPFNNVVVWLRDLNASFQIDVSQVSIDRDEKGGLVNVRLTLKG